MERETALIKAKEKHGDKFTYKTVDYLEGQHGIDLRLLQDNQRVCAGNDDFYILMTENINPSELINP